MNQNNYYSYGAPAYNFPFGGYGAQPQAMPMYNTQPMKQPEYTNPLGAAKIKELLEKGNGGPKIALTEEDFYEAICTHRFNNHLEVIEIGDGKLKCKICGAEFTPVENADIEDVKRATENLLNILHTAKLAWLDVPDKVATEFFQAMAVVKKTPELFKIAMSNFAQYTGYQVQNVNYPINGFGLMNQILGPQPYTGYVAPYAQPQSFQQQPVAPYGFNAAAQQMQAAAPGISNGFGYNAPQPLQEVAPPQQPKQDTAQAPANNGETVTTKLHV